MKYCCFLIQAAVQEQYQWLINWPKGKMRKKNKNKSTYEILCNVIYTQDRSHYALSDWPAIGKYSCLAEVTSRANQLLKNHEKFSLLTSIQFLCEKQSFCLILASSSLQWNKSTSVYPSNWVKSWIVALGSLWSAKYSIKRAERRPQLE